MRISSEAATRGEESGARIQESGEDVVRRTVEIIGPSDATISGKTAGGEPL
jgi:hypothetical protein